MTRDRLVLSLADARAADASLVGGKGANLGELVHLGLPVPAGFCVTTAAFEAFMAGLHDVDALYGLLDSVATHDVEAAREVGRRVRRALSGLPIPPDVAGAVVEHWRAHDDEGSYAVRSSATAEDLPGASFAGQQDTYLNVRGEDDLVDAVRRCWVSLFTDRAILYRAQNGFPHRDVRLAVVVQEMVDAEVSGVLFTADPVTGHRPTLTIDATFGLGESLVGGLVTPDFYRLDKRSRQVVDRQVADKETAVVPLAHGGTRQVPVPESERSRATLTDAQVLELADLGIRAEAHFGAPQDMEWALVGGAVRVLQSRPITSLFPVDGLRSPDGSLHVFFNMGYQQNMTKAMTPLGMSCIRAFIPLGHVGNRAESIHVRPNGGRLFTDLTLPLRHPVGRRVVMAVLSQFDALAPESLRLAIGRPEFRRPRSAALSPGAVRTIAHLMLRTQKALWVQDPSGVADEVDALIEQHVRDVRRRLGGLTSPAAQVTAVIQVLRHLHLVVLQWAPRFAAGALAHRLLLRLGRDWADPQDLADYPLGLPGNVVTEMTLALGDVAQSAARSPALVAWFAQVDDDSQAWLAEAATIEGSGPFLEHWEEFLRRYGCRGSAEVDIGAPRWYEEPLPLLKTLAGYVQQDDGGHRSRQAALAEAAGQAARRLVAAARRGPAGAVRARVVRRLIAVSQSGGVLREHHKFLAVQVMREVKETLKDVAVTLTDSGRLSRPDDVWFLTLPELQGLVDADGGDVAERVPARRADLTRFEAMTPPMVLTSDGETPAVRYHVDDAPPGALLGQPVSGGIVEARVHVIHDPQSESLAPGEVLVAKFTDPGWTPLFLNAGGLVTEVGGLLTHGSVVAREYGIPAVVGVRGATSALRTGQTVRLDGSRGVVEVLDDAHP